MKGGGACGRLLAIKGGSAQRSTAVLERGPDRVMGMVR